jgi:hypothetical protein
VNVSQPPLLPEEEEGDLLEEEAEALAEDEEPAFLTPAPAGGGYVSDYEDEDADEDEDYDEEREPQEGNGREFAPLTAPLGRPGVSMSFPREDSNLRAEPAGGGRPPRGPAWASEEREDNGGSGGRGLSKFLRIVVIVASTAIAAYLGVAVGSSLRSGGGDGNDSSAAAVLPTRMANLKEAACSPGPVVMPVASSAALVFGDAPGGYKIAANPGVRALSGQASLESVSVIAQDDNTVLFIAGPNPGAAGRTDEYGVSAVFSKGSDRKTLECVVQVKGAGATPTVTPTKAATATTPAPTATSAAPTSTPTVRVVVPVQPTNTPTSTPVVPTAVPTETPTPTPAIAVGTLLTVPSPTSTPTLASTHTPNP